jgi:hypothetical protein
MDNQAKSAGDAIPAECVRIEVYVARGALVHGKRPNIPLTLR